MRLTPEQLQPRTKFPQFVPSGAAQPAKVGPRPALYPDDLLTAEPARSDCLLTDMDGQDVFRAGKVGILSARGGSGKTWFLVQLALAVATGRPLFGTYKPKQGRVLLVLAEEEQSEVFGRLYWAAQAGGFGEAEHRDVHRNLDSLTMEGLATCLTTEEFAPGELPVSEFALHLESLLAEGVAIGHPYSLVILDPLARFAGMDAEVDSASATQFIQVVERLKMSHLGGASVILAHHGNKGTPGGADSVRGSSALVDGARWVGTLAQVDDGDEATDIVRFCVAKSNYAAKTSPLYLRPADSFHGALRTCTDDEIPGKGEDAPASRADLEASILDALKREPMSSRANFSLVGGNKGNHHKTWHLLVAAGRIRQLPPKPGSKSGGHPLWCAVDATSANTREMRYE